MRVLQVESGTYLWVFKVVVYGFKIIGLAPFAIATKTCKICVNSRSQTRNAIEFSFSGIGFIYNLLVSTIFLVITGISTPYILKPSYADLSSVTQSEDLILIIFCVLTVCTVITHWAFGQSNAASVMNRLSKVDLLVSGLETQSQSVNKRFLLFMVHVVVNASICTTLVIVSVIGFHDILAFYVFSEIPSFVICCYIIQYSIVAGLVSTNLERINAILSEFNKSPNHMFGHTTTVLISGSQSHLAALRLLKTIRTTVSEVSRDISDFYSFPILVCIAYLFVTLVSNVYFIVAPILVPNFHMSFYIIIHTVACISIRVYPLVSISFQITRTMNEAKLTGWLIHKLLASEVRQVIKEELEQFSLQLLHENMSFTACGFFSLDCGLLHSIIAATATYLVILIQFLLSNKT